MPARTETPDADYSCIQRGYHWRVTSPALLTGVSHPAFQILHSGPVVHMLQKRTVAFSRPTLFYSGQFGKFRPPESLFFDDCNMYPKSVTMSSIFTYMVSEDDQKLGNSSFLGCPNMVHKFLNRSKLRIYGFASVFP